MAYYLTVTGGTDEGKTFRIEAGECLIGRSPSAQLLLRDDTVAWEHALVKETNGKLVLQNLSALGTRVKGRRITDEVRLNPNDEIQLSDRCRIILEQRLGRGGRDAPSRLTAVLLTMLVLIVIVGGGALLLSGSSEPLRPNPTAKQWRQAYQRIDNRLEQWSGRGAFPQEAVTLYRDGWRLERAQNHTAALEKWKQLRGMLLRIPLPGADAEERTIAQCAGPDPTALGVVMGWNRQASSADFRWKSDEAFADALVWFVKTRERLSATHAED